MRRIRKFQYIAPPLTTVGSPLGVGRVSRLYHMKYPLIKVEQVATRFADSEAERGTKKWQRKYIFATRYLETDNFWRKIANETTWAEVIVEWDEDPDPTPPYVGEKTMARIMGL